MSHQQTLLKQLMKDQPNVPRVQNQSVFNNYSMDKDRSENAQNLFQHYKMLRRGVVPQQLDCLDYDSQLRRNSAVDTKKLSELQQLIQNRNNSIFSAANAQKLDSNFLSGKHEHGSTQQDAASTNPSSYLPAIAQAGSETDKKSKFHMNDTIAIQLMDSDDDFGSDNFSARDSQKDSQEVFTVIKKDQNRVSPGA